MRAKILAITVVLTALTAACGEGGGSSTPSPTADATGGRPQSTATLTIVSPEAGASVEGPDVTVRARVDGGTILEKASRDLRPDTGHIHVLLRKLPGGTQSTVTILAGETYTIENLDPGQYVVTVEFAAADHGVFDPRVTDSVTITVT